MANQKVATDKVKLARHQAQCKICKSPEREDLEMLYLNWKSPYAIAEHYQGIFSVDSIYRHVNAVQLDRQRRNYLSVALQKIIEKVDQINPTGSTVLAAIKALDKMNSQEQPEAPPPSPDPRELWARMSPAEREVFAAKGRLPDWYLAPAPDTSADDEGVEEKIDSLETERPIAQGAGNVAPELGVHQKEEVVLSRGAGEAVDDAS